MKKFLKKQKGITLVALIITIVVMLILAAVTIGAVTGDGLFSKTRQATETYENAVQDEGDTLQSLMNQIDQALEENKPEESYDGLYSMGGLEGKIAPTDLFEFDTTIGEVDANILGQFSNLSNKATKITRIKPEYCNVGGYNPKTDEWNLTDTNYEINYEGITDTLVIPYEVTIDGEKYTVTDVDISISGDAYGWRVWNFPYPEIETIVYPNTVINIDCKGNAYNLDYQSKSSALSKVVFSKNLQKIPDYFLENSSITTVTIPSSVKSIGNNAFSRCGRLTNITIPSSVTSIGDGAFSGCVGLTNITIPNSVTSIGAGAFNDCSNLANIIVDNGNNNFAAENGILFNKNKTEIISYPTASGAFVIPDSVTSIGDSAFYNCTNLTNITIPNSVTSIGDSTFYRCRNLTSITIPSSVTSIGDSAFKNCSELSTITIQKAENSIIGAPWGADTKITTIKWEP